jgi:hypothetical protein
LGTVCETVPLVSVPFCQVLQAELLGPALCAPPFPLQSENLFPFALWLAFPTALDGRDSIDYYGNSVIWSDIQALLP